MESLPVSYINNSVGIKQRKMINIQISEEQLLIDGLVEIKKTPIAVNKIYTINRRNKLYKLKLVEKKYIEQNKFKMNIIQAINISILSIFFKDCLDNKKDGVKMITELIKVKINIYTFSL